MVLVVRSGPIDNFLETVNQKRILITWDTLCIRGGQSYSSRPFGNVTAFKSGHHARASYTSCPIIPSNNSDERCNHETGNSYCANFTYL